MSAGYQPTEVMSLIQRFSALSLVESTSWSIELFSVGSVVSESPPLVVAMADNPLGETIEKLTERSLPLSKAFVDKK
jgi:hypothetical protein